MKLDSLKIDKENLRNKINIARTQFVYYVEEPLNLLNKLISVVLSYNKELILYEIVTPNMYIQASIEAITELMKASKDFYNISIVLNKDVILGVAYENEILKVTKDMRIAEGGDLIKKSLY